jgi:hypothetical protein
MRTFALSLLLVLPLAFGAACTTEEGTTPECEQNSGVDGIVPSELGCHQFASCDGDPSAVACCGQNQPMLVDCEIVLCRFGYGVTRDQFRPDERGCLTGNFGTGGSGTGGGGGSP